MYALQKSVSLLCPKNVVKTLFTSSYINNKTSSNYCAKKQRKQPTSDFNNNNVMCNAPFFHHFLANQTKLKARKEIYKQKQN